MLPFFTSTEGDLEADVTLVLADFPEMEEWADRVEEIDSWDSLRVSACDWEPLRGGSSGALLFWLEGAL